MVKTEAYRYETLVIYDSAYGNTAKVAKVIAGAVGHDEAARLMLARNVTAADLETVDTLIVGCPTQGGRPTKDIQELFKRLPDDALEGARVAAFDTRFAINEHGFGLHLLMKTIGFAAGDIASELQDKGGEMIAKPEGFIVEDKKGPLKAGELQRAIDWAKGIGTRIKAS